MDPEGPGFLLTITAFIVGLGGLVFIHEWGHYSVARLFGMTVDRFSIGFGRELVGLTDRAGTRWSISLIPLGGYVKFTGDRSAASDADSEALAAMSEAERANCFQFRPLYQRALVVFAGPAINLLVAMLIFAGFYWQQGIVVTPPVLETILPDSPAAAAGLMDGDRILKIGGERVERFNDIATFVRLHPGQQVSAVIERGGAEQTLRLEVGARYQEDRFGNRYAYGYLGAQATRADVQLLGPVGALAEGWRQVVQVTRSIFTTLGQTILGLRSLDEIGGPVRIATMVGEAAHIGFASFILFLALISVNLGIMNLLPVPVLDGGHLLFYAVEALKGSPVPEKAQELGYMVGMALMLLLMILVTVNDLQSLTG